MQVDERIDVCVWGGGGGYDKNSWNTQEMIKQS